MIKRGGRGKSKAPPSKTEGRAPRFASPHCAWAIRPSGTLHTLAVKPNDSVYERSERKNDHERFEKLYVGNSHKLFWEDNQQKDQAPEYGPTCDEKLSKHKPLHALALFVESSGEDKPGSNTARCPTKI